MGQLPETPSSEAALQYVEEKLEAREKELTEERKGSAEPTADAGTEEG